MAEKKLPNMAKGLGKFKEVMLRSSLIDYNHINGVLISKSPKGHTIFIIPDPPLMNAISEDKEFMAHITELDINDHENVNMVTMLLTSGLGLDDGWVSMDSDLIYSGKVFKIHINGFDYKIPINRDLLPFKLRKAEHDNLRYRVYISPKPILGISKRFEMETDVGSAGYSVIRLFTIV